MTFLSKIHAHYTKNVGSFISKVESELSSRQQIEHMSNKDGQAVFKIHWGMANKAIASGCSFKVPVSITIDGREDEGGYLQYSYGYPDIMSISLCFNLYSFYGDRKNPHKADLTIVKERLGYADALTKAKSETKQMARSIKKTMSSHWHGNFSITEDRFDEPAFDTLLNEVWSWGD